MIDQKNLENDIKLFLSEYGSDSYKTTADFFALVYHKYVGKLAMDPSGNQPIRTEGKWDSAWGNKNREDRKENSDASTEGLQDPPTDWKWSNVSNEWVYLGGKLKGLKNAFTICFIMQSKSPVSLGKVPYFIVSASIVKYWVAQSFGTLIPHVPGIGPGIANLVTNPGTPMKLGSDLYSAFTSKSYEQTAKKFTKAVLDHADTIQGRWTGPHTGTPPPIASVNWSGLM